MLFMLGISDCSGFLYYFQWLSNQGFPKEKKKLLYGPLHTSVLNLPKDQSFVCFFFLLKFFHLRIRMSCSFFLQRTKHVLLSLSSLQFSSLKMLNLTTCATFQPFTSSTLSDFEWGLFDVDHSLFFLPFFSLQPVPSPAIDAPSRTPLLFLAGTFT